MTVTAEEKMWLVMEAIASGFDITPEGKCILINPESIKISGVDLSQILAKLATDKKLIEIISRPIDFKIGVGSDCYEIKITNQSEFRTFLNFAHSRHFGTINRLAGDNFFAVCDVAMDILSEL